MPKVREAIGIVERDGWQFDRRNGSHRIFKHPVKPGSVTIPGHPSDDLKIKTWRSILRQAGIRR
ncbi:MAG: type II toxin-antitoxin system HicA family toxin [Chloroflexi bacterium]|nr:type II toxin-antitoxin system HicA family toxin [Chloroflexota bacterium]